MNDRIERILDALRQKMLEAAVRGELVPQHPEDEPASILLERIAAEKEKLIRVGKIKRPKSTSRIYKRDGHFYESVNGGEATCIDEEIPFEIPDSWGWARLENLGYSNLGKTLDKGKNTGQCHPYLCSINVYWNGISLASLKQALFEPDELVKYAVEPGDLLICEGGDVGRAAIWEENIPMCYQNALHRVRFYGGYNPYFVKYLLEFYKADGTVDKMSKGMTIKHLVQKSLIKMIIPVPPLAEQQRIVNALKARSERLDAIRQSRIRYKRILSETPTSLRQQLIQAAIQGRLVPQNSDDEPASLLLERIVKERERLIQEKKIKRPKSTSRIHRRDGHFYESVNGGNPICIDDQLPFDIPDSWEWVRLSDIAYGVGNKNNQILAKEVKKTGRYPVVSQGSDLIDGYSDDANKVVDILPLVMFGDHTRNVKYIDFSFIIGADGTKFLSPIVLSASYLYYLLSFVAENLRNRGYARHFSLLSKEYLPIPPLQEQRRICDRLDKLLNTLKG